MVFIVNAINVLNLGGAITGGLDVYPKRNKLNKKGISLKTRKWRIGIRIDMTPMVDIAVREIELMRRAKEQLQQGTS